eukprot:CAMPEP_0206205200 /NCGR_PEP_ID=MMETSP0166-20121206/14050_1 /ASSEMBLY_ACC=CAM_ASM_000260 /TAXON_ID=95228 /ORGANISM="Vannella robusta, Strain DIVA3 518/3/11/1/6" /LENGTH=543 /DNA_ID=CAMNT_0053625117 /DNA_START=222 /DNA_END=1853 /DNA_ORIENTATION=+
MSEETYLSESSSFYSDSSITEEDEYTDHDLVRYTQSLNEHEPLDVIKKALISGEPELPPADIVEDLRSVPIPKEVKKISYAQVKLKYHTFRKSLKLQYWIWHPYWWWWYLCAFCNVPLIILFFTQLWSPRIPSLMVVVNVTAAVLMRNSFFKRVLYEIETVLARALLKLPGQCIVKLIVFQINRAIHNLSGVHTGCAIFVLIWAVIFLVMAPIRFSQGLFAVSTLKLIGLEVTAGIFFICVSVMCFFAIPPIRLEHHNLFEQTHRFFGWGGVVATLAHVFIARGPLFPFNPEVLLALSITTMVFYPWVIMRRAENVKILKAGTRAIALAYQPQLVNCTPGTLIKFSFSPLKEWHTFAVAGPIPAHIRKDDEETALTSIIARAGDWTGKLIDNQLPKTVDEEIGTPAEVELGTPLHRPLWIHFHTPPGFVFSARAYTEVLFVATGAGIAPIMYYLHPENPLVEKRNVLWIGNKPKQTFGVFAETVFSIPDLVVHDTSLKGRPVVDKLVLLQEPYNRLAFSPIFHVMVPNGTLNAFSAINCIINL